MVDFMIDEREYMFASSFLKACDSAGTAGERLARFAESGSAAALHGAVSEAFHLTAPSGTDDGAALYDRAFLDACKKVSGAVPDYSVFYPLLYKYDCTNIKTAIKASVRGVDSRGMLFSCGTVSAEKIAEGGASGHFEGLPPAMSAAADEALKFFGKTGEVRAIDIILDRACFRDMADSAEEGGVELIRNIVRMRADGVNILAAMRIAASGMPPESQKPLMERVFVPGGGVPLSVLITSDGGCAGISDIAKKAGARLGGLADAVSTAAKEAGLTFVQCEKLFDEAVLRLCDSFRYKPFGPEIAVRFIVIREAEIMNARLIEAGLAAGLSADAIRERLRESYV